MRECLAEDTATGYRDAALIALMSDCLLRASEALALTWLDIDLETRTLTIRRSKTDREGVGAEIAFGSSTENVLRAWLAMLDYEPTDPVFRKVFGEHVGEPLTSVNSVRNIIARRAPKATAHSLRVGSAQSLVAAGASTAQLAQAGRWEREPPYRQPLRPQGAPLESTRRQVKPSSPRRDIDDRPTPTGDQHHEDRDQPGCVTPVAETPRRSGATTATSGARPARPSTAS